MDAKLLGKCGFYCGACPTYIAGNCKGCTQEHTKGDCFSHDCVTEKVWISVDNAVVFLAMIF